MLRVALISEHASPLASPGSVDCGGQNVYVAHLAAQLAKLGHKIDIFTRCDCPEQKQILTWQPNIRVIHVPAGPPCYMQKEKILPYMEDFSRFMLQFMRRQKTHYDIMHANFFMSGWVAQQIKYKLNIPYVITFHALGMIRRLLQGSADEFPTERTAIEKSLMQDADRVIAECMQDRLDMERYYDADRRRIDIVPCGFDPEELWPMRAQARRQLGLAADEYIILQLGRIVPRKGVDNVIQSLAALRDRFGIRARLLVVGGNKPRVDATDSPEMARLLALSASLGLQRQVDFIGQKPRNELASYYSAADVFVTTPWYEPFGITPLEAMACATPVIGAAVGGIKSTVQEGITGFLVPPKNPQALADRLARLHAEPDLARRFGEAGWRRAHALYTWRSVAETIASIYETVVDGATSTQQAASALTSSRSGIALH